MILALANFLKGNHLASRFKIAFAYLHDIGYSHWSKDIILIVSDDYLAGMQAWLSAYHGELQDGWAVTAAQETYANLCTGLSMDPIKVPSGVIWTALNIDYSGHSFSHLGIFHGMFMLKCKGSCLTLRRP